MIDIDAITLFTWAPLGGHQSPLGSYGVTKSPIGATVGSHGPEELRGAPTGPQYGDDFPKRRKLWPTAKYLAALCFRSCTYCYGSYVFKLVVVPVSGSPAQVAESNAGLPH